MKMMVEYWFYHMFWVFVNRSKLVVNGWLKEAIFLK